MSYAGSELMLGLGALSQASSIYLKDRDPKLLEKKPFLKRAYESLKEKIADYMPQPAPVPVPVEAHSLEDYVGQEAL